MLHFAPMPFSLPQMPIGMEIYHLQADFVIFGSDPYPDTLSPLCDLVALRNLLQEDIKWKRFDVYHQLSTSLYNQCLSSSSIPVNFSCSVTATG